MTDDNPIMGIKTKACVNGVYPDTIPTIQQDIANIEDDIDDINTELDNVVHKTGNEEIGGEKTFTEDIVTSGGTDSMAISDVGSITFNKVIDDETVSSVFGFEYDEEQEQSYMYAPSFTPVDENDNPIAPYDGVVLTSKNLDVDPRIIGLDERITTLEQSGGGSEWIKYNSENTLTDIIDLTTGKSIKDIKICFNSITFGSAWITQIEKNTSIRFLKFNNFDFRCSPNDSASNGNYYIMGLQFSDSVMNNASFFNINSYPLKAYQLVVSSDNNTKVTWTTCYYYYDDETKNEYITIYYRN